MSAVDLDRVRLPRAGAIVEVTTAFELYRGELIGVLPGRDDAAAVKDRRPKLALRNAAMSVALRESDIRAIRTVRRAPRKRQK
jgi:hypothetical protein